MLKISLHVPLGRGTKKSVWESRTFKSAHAECLVDPWSDHALLKLPHVSSKNVRGASFSAKDCTAICLAQYFITAATMRGQSRELPRNLGKGWQFFSARSRPNILSRGARTE